MPYWRLSSFYLFYFASLGALIPYWGLYLKHLGFNIADIGTLMAIIMATKVISPNIWGWIADHTGKRMAIVRLGSLLAAITFACVFWVQSYWWLALVMLLFSFFWNAALPQFEATTFTHLRDDVHRYSSIRLWGSIGFVLTVGGLGLLLEGKGIVLLPMVLLMLYTGIWLSSLTVPEQAAGHLSLDHEPLKSVLRRPQVLGLLVACFLMQASHGPYYTFYSIYMQEHHYDLEWVGSLWALGVIAEILIFLLMHRMVPKFGLRNLLLISLALATLRWILTAMFPENVMLMILAQILHAATFGVYHASAIQLIHHHFSGRHQGKGQALYSSLSFGAGGAIGSLYAGYSWELFGAETTYLLAAGVSLVAFFVAWKWVAVER
jgi:MFS transporter, PPP family, 3-phenylpropionic acid transporter